MRPVWLGACATALLISTAGCFLPILPDAVSEAPSGEGSAGAPARGGSQPTTTASYAVPASQIGPLGPEMPPLDQGRLTLAQPQDWYRNVRSSSYLARFSIDQRANYPTIVITGDDAGELPMATPRNVALFAKRFSTQAPTEGLEEPVMPRLIGSFAGASYTQKAVTRQSGVVRNLELLVLATVRGGRLYRVELRAEEGTLDKYRPQAYAVASSMQFGESQDATPSADILTGETLPMSPEGETTAAPAGETSPGA